MAIVKIKAPTAWDTIPTGLVASGDVLSLDRIEDYFNDGSLNTTNFGALTSGNGTVKENDALELNTPIGTDAAAIYLKTAVSKAVNDIYTWRWRPEDSLHYPILIQQNIGAPIVGGSAAVDAVRIIAVFLLTPTTLGIFYIDNLNTGVGWNGVAWGPTFPSIATLTKGFLYETRLEVDDVNSRWRLIVNDITNGTVITVTDWITWAATRDTGSGELWFGIGDFYTSVLNGRSIVSSFRNQFKSGPLVATMGEIAGVGTAIEQIPITESVEAGASISYKYNLNRTGLSASKTLAELQSELVGQVMNFLDIEATFTSDGEDAASFDINGGAIACPSATCDFPTVGEVTEGTIYDNGNLTGTYKEVPEAKAELGFDYGAGGTEFTGTLAATIKGPIKLLKLDTGIKVIKL